MFPFSLRLPIYIAMCDDLSLSLSDSGPVDNYRVHSLDENLLVGCRSRVDLLGWTLS